MAIGLIGLKPVFCQEEAKKTDETTEPQPEADKAPEDSSSIHKASKILLQDFISPISTEARYVFVGGAMATLFVAFNGHDYNKRARSKTLYSQPLKKYGYVGEVVGWGFLNGLYGMSFLIHGLAAKDPLSLERAEMMASASLMTLGVTSLAKATINARRPGYPEKRDSFPSGHASMSFAFATLVAAEHPWYWSIPAFSVASFISYSRVHDDWHWLKDVVAGAGLGASYGLGVWLNRRKKEVPFIISMIPLPKSGMALGFSTRF